MGDAFSASIATGGASYSLPFVLPSGRAGVAPTLGLSYGSSAGQSVAGMGCQLNVPSIVRASDRGTPQYHDGASWAPGEDRFSYGGQDLVPVASADMTAVDGGTVPTDLTGYQQYRTRVESEFSRVFRSPDGLKWVVQTREGRRYDFGVIGDGPAELLAPNLTSGLKRAGEDLTGSGAALTAQAGQVFQWWLTRTSDAHGSTIYYRYEQIEGQVYLSDVYYVSPQACAGSPTAALRCSQPLSSYGVRVHLVYEGRTDPVTSYRAGFKVRLTRRLKRVEITSAGTEAGARYLTRRYHLRYDDRSYHSLLRSVQLEGRPEQLDASTQVMVGNAAVPESSLGDDLIGVLQPALRFGYTGDDRLLAGSFGFPSLDPTLKSAATSPSVSLNDARTDLFDVNRDGLPDLIVTDPVAYRTAAGGPAVGAFFNGFSGNSALPAAPGQFSGAVPMAVGALDEAILQLTNPSLRSFEVDGDGGSEFLHIPSRNAYAYYTVSRDGPSADVKPSAHGYRWTKVPVSFTGAIDTAVDFSDAARIRMLDVNGDGLVDILRAASDQIETWFNLGFYPGGDGRFGSARYVNGALQLSAAPVTKCLPTTPGLPLSFADPGVLVADVNGDGLSDIARLTSSTLIYWPNRGNGYFGTGDSSCAHGLVASVHTEVQNPPRFVAGLEPKLLLADMDADGLSDVVLLGDGTATVWFNCGGERFTNKVILRNLPHLRDVETLVRAIDLDGTGTVDLVFGFAGDWKWLDPAGGMRPRLLRAVENGLGARSDVEYASSVVDYLRDLAAADACASGTCESFSWSHVSAECDGRIQQLTGQCVHKPAGSPLLPTVVRSLTVRDGLGSMGLPESVQRTEYAYHDPFYEGISHEFRGFAVGDTVSIGDAQHPGSTERVRMFVAERPAAIASDRLVENPLDSLQGRRYLSESFAADGSYLATTHTSYTVRELVRGLDGRPITFSFADRVDTLKYDVTNFSAAAPSLLASNPMGGGNDFPAITFERVRNGVVQADPTQANAVHRIHLRSESYAHTIGRNSDVDNAGHVGTSSAYGRLRGEFGEQPADESIVTHNTWALQGPSDRWLWRPQRSYVDGHGTSERLDEMQWEYDAEGDTRLTREVLASASPYLFAGDADGALAFTPARSDVISSTRDDTWGQTTALCGGGDLRGGSLADCLRYSETSYDAAYAQVPIRKAIATDRIGSADFSFLTSVLEVFDRGLEVGLRTRDMNGVASESGVDGLGRPTYFRSASAAAECPTASHPHTRIRYFVTTDGAARPVSYVETEVERACTPGADVAHARTYYDGLSRPRATLVSAETPHAWQRSGIVVYDAQGSIVRNFHPDFMDAPDPTPQTVLALPTSASQVHSFDAFGRPRCTLHEDGTSLTCVGYHALSQDVCDPDDHVQDSRFFHTCTTIRSDGHGRAIDTIQRNVQPDGTHETYRLFQSYRADGTEVSLTRAQTRDEAPRELTQVVPGHSATRTFAYDSLGRKIASTDPDTDGRASGLNVYNRSWRYLYNRVGDVVAARDARGCGVNTFFDLAGRPIGTQYVGCGVADGMERGSASVPAGTVALDALSSPITVDARDYFDAYPDWAVAALAPVVWRSSAIGRKTASMDRAQRTVFSYNRRGALIASARQMALISSPAAVSAHSADKPQRRVSAATADAVVYDQTHTYQGSLEYDYAARLRSSHLPTDPSYASSEGAPQIVGLIDYNARSLPSSTSVAIDGVVYPVIAATSYDAHGQLVGQTFGDAHSGHPATTWKTELDARLRPYNTRVVRTPTLPASSARRLGEISVVFDQHYTWDPANNLSAVDDLRPGSEHPNGHRPQSATIDRDALYRITDVAYQYSGDGASSSFDVGTDFREAVDAVRELDPMNGTTAPSVATAPPGRVEYMTWTHDWLGNVRDWDDDAGAFYERSLGFITNGADEANGRPSALRFASTLPREALASSSSERGGYLSANYGEGGYLEGLTVHGQCFDAPSTSCWDGRESDLVGRESTLATRCKCKVEQYYEYHWDELGHVAEARRYDRDTAGWALSARMRYGYSSEDQRLIKQVLSDGDERIALYIAPGDFERRGLVRADDGYRNASDRSETQYMVAGARLVWQPKPRTSGLDPDHRLTLNVTDLIGTTAAVIDLRSGELLELSTYYPNGAQETLRIEEEQGVPREPSGFSGQEADEAVGLTYFGARYLVPHLGRWASPDPAQMHGQAGGESLNNYHYISGNLLQGRDPLGLSDPDSKSAFEADQIKDGWTWQYELPLASKGQTFGRATWLLFDEKGEYTHNRGNGYAYPAVGLFLANSHGKYFSATAGGTWEEISGQDYERLNYVGSCMSQADCVERWKSYNNMAGIMNVASTYYFMGLTLAVPGGGLTWDISNTIDACKDGMSWGCGLQAGVTLLGAGNELSMLKTSAPTLSAEAAAEHVEEAMPKVARGEGCSSCSCFLPGTQILMADGTTKSIEDVLEGDVVAADDPQDAEPSGGFRVLATHQNYTQRVISLTVHDVHGDESLIEATGEHPFWTKEQGWVSADELMVGDMLLDAEGRYSVEVIASSVQSRATPTYNLTVEQAHSYFVAVQDAAVLVHNQGHEASFRILGVDGNTRVIGNVVSGPMSFEEQIEGLGRARQLVHTENRIVRTVSLLPGETLIIDGFLEPCNNCRGAMNRLTAAVPWTKVKYTWIDELGDYKSWTSVDGYKLCP